MQILGGLGFKVHFNAEEFWALRLEELGQWFRV